MVEYIQRGFFPQKNNKFQDRGKTNFKEKAIIIEAFIIYGPQQEVDCSATVQLSKVGGHT